MAIAVKEPKRVSVNTLKEVLGEKRAIAILAEIRQTETMHRFASITSIEAEATLQFMAGEVTTSNANMAGRVLRRYALLGSPKVKNSIRGWLAMQTTSPNGTEPKVVRTRTVITDPAVIEKRKAALAKARIALAKKRRASKGK